MRVQITTLQCLLSEGQQTGLFPQQKMNHVGFQTKYLTSIAFFFIWADRDRSFWWSHGRIAAFNKAAKYFSNTVLGPVNQSCRFSLLWKLKDELLSSYISLITVFIFVYWTQVSDLISREVRVQYFQCPRWTQIAGIYILFRPGMLTYVPALSSLESRLMWSAPSFERSLCLMINMNPSTMTIAL